MAEITSIAGDKNSNIPLEGRGKYWRVLLDQGKAVAQVIHLGCGSGRMFTSFISTVRPASFCGALL